MRLDEMQRKAAEGIDASMAVSAGAGAGKTRVLTERIRNILTRTDERVLAITFTVRAAEEMRARIEAAVDDLDPGRVKVSTIDGFCRHLLHIHSDRAGTLGGMEQLQEGEARAMLEASYREIEEALIALGADTLMHALDMRPAAFSAEVMDFYEELRTRGNLHAFRTKRFAATDPEGELMRHVLYMKQNYPKGNTKFQQALKAIDDEALSALSGADRTAFLESLPAPGGKSTFRPEDQEKFDRLRREMMMAREEENRPYTEILAQIFRRLDENYRKHKDAAGAVDFADLLEKATALIEAEPALSASYGHILVDEFQDTNPLQIRFLERLAESSTVFVVGDKKQSIYGFRGADLDESAAFRRKLKEAGGVVAELTNNYRSHAALVDAINEIFAPQMPDYVPLAGHGTGDVRLEAVDLGESASQEERVRKEAEWIAADIQEGGGGSRALLLRTTTHAAIYEAVFQAYGIRYRNRSGRGFFETREVRDLLALLRAKAKGTFDAEALRGPFVGYNREDLFLEAKDPNYSTQKKRACLDLLQKIDAYGSAYDALQTAVYATGYAVYVRERRGEQGIANLDRLFALAKEYDAEGSTLYGFVGEMERCARWEDEGQARFGGDADIEISTIHKAKGLEYDTVYLGALFTKEKSDGGHWNYSDLYGAGLCRDGARYAFDQNADAMARFREEEARRLLYVAMTRAKSALVLLRSGKETEGFSGFLQSVAFTADPKMPKPPKRAQTVPPAHAVSAPVSVASRKPVTSASALLQTVEAPYASAGFGKKEAARRRHLGVLFHHYMQRAQGPDARLRAHLLASARRRGLDEARLSAYIDAYDDLFGWGEILAAEVPFVADFPRVILEGAFDQIRRIDGKIAIVDMKTGTRGAESPAMAVYRLQLGLYGMAYRQIRGTFPALYIYTPADGKKTEVRLTTEEITRIEKMLKG